LLVAGRVIARRVESVKIVELSFYLRTFSQSKTHSVEDVDDLLSHLSQRMNMPQTRSGARQSDVDFFTAELSFQFHAVDVILSLFQPRLDLLFDLIGQLADLRALFLA